MQIIQRTPNIHQAVIDNDFELVKECVLNRRISPAKEDKYKSTALHHAAERGNVEILEFLLNNCNNKERYVNKRNKGKFSALYYALMLDDKSCAYLLIEHGALLSSTYAGRDRAIQINALSSCAIEILEHSEVAGTTDMNMVELMLHVKNRGSFNLDDKKLLSTRFVLHPDNRKRVHNIFSSGFVNYRLVLFLLKLGFSVRGLEVNWKLRDITYKKYHNHIQICKILIKFLNFGADKFTGTSSYTWNGKLDSSDDEVYERITIPLWQNYARLNQKTAEILKLYPQTVTLQTLCNRVVFRHQLHIGNEETVPKLMLKFPNEIEEFKAYNERIIELSKYLQHNNALKI